MSTETKPPEPTPKKPDNPLESTPEKPDTSKIQITKEELMRMIQDRPVEADILQQLFEITDKRSKSYFPNWDFVRCVMVLDEVERLLTEDDPELGNIPKYWKESLLLASNSKGGFLFTNARDVLMKQDVTGLYMAPQTQDAKKKGWIERLRGGSTNEA